MTDMSYVYIGVAGHCQRKHLLFMLGLYKAGLVGTYFSLLPFFAFEDKENSVYFLGSGPEGN